MKSNCYHLKCGIYRSDLILHIGDSESASEAFKSFLYKKYGKSCKNIWKSIESYVNGPDNTSDDWCMDCRDEDGKQKIIINIREFNNKDADNIGSISHECNHAAIFILDRCGIQNDKAGFESLTYLQDFLLTEFIKKIQKRKK